MDWSNERYVRVYLRDTPEWTLLSWEARGLFLLLLRAVDRAGVLELGRSGTRALASLLRMPVEVVDRGLEELLTDGCLERHGEVLLVRNYIEAQEAAQSDKVRQAESRERRRASARRAEVTNRDDLSRNVTERHERSRAVTSGHEASQDVTPAVPCRAVPSQPCSDLPPVGATGTGQAEFQHGGIEPSGAAGELDLEIQVAPGAKVAAKAVKPRGKKPNASDKASAAPTGGFRRQLTDALDAAFFRATGERYDWQADKRNFGAEGLGSTAKAGALYRLAERHGIPAVAASFELGVREFYREHAAGGRRVAHPWQLPRAWAALVDARPVEPVAPQGPAWMTGEVGERWRQAVEESGRGPAFGEVAKLVVAAEQDIDVLRLAVQDENARAWIGQRTPDPWSNKPAASLLDMLHEWLGPVRIEVQPGGET